MALRALSIIKQGERESAGSQLCSQVVRNVPTSSPSQPLAKPAKRRLFWRALPSASSSRLARLFVKVSQVETFVWSVVTVSSTLDSLVSGSVILSTPFLRSCCRRHDM